MKKRVLIVEDNDVLQECWRDRLGDKIEIVSALTIEEAEAQFDANPDFAAIAMDACVPGGEINTQPLVRKIRSSGFAGPMIAMSNESKFNDMLVEAGCNHKSEKARMPKLLLEILCL